ncbi:MAG: hypothetical protein DMG13_05790, partial [Acidobacteria bacterium]
MKERASPPESKDVIPPSPVPAPHQSSLGYGLERPVVRGKFLYCGDRKLWVRGISYGTFRPDEHGSEFHDPERIERDF